MSLLIKLNVLNIQWIAWHLNTPLDICKIWNKKRKRQVSDEIIANYHQYLKDFPAIPAEGFTAVHTIHTAAGKFDINQIIEKTKIVSKTQTNRTNRTQNSQVQLHQYSRLLDFERLMHLIALIIQYPGIGALYQNEPSTLTQILSSIPKINSEVEEVCACIAKLYGKIYADGDAIAADLEWLEQNGITSANNLNNDLDLYNIEYEELTTHAYSDQNAFSRLLKTIRLVIHHPFLFDSQQGGSLKTLVTELVNRKIIDDEYLDRIRSDIDKYLKPYKILPNFSLRRGYFAGTALLNQNELSKVFNILQSQVITFDDPLTLQVYENFKERMILSKFTVEDVYPLRAIGNRSIVDVKHLPFGALLKRLEFLEEAIINGKILELKNVVETAKFPNWENQESIFMAYPLQIVFHNVAWYLGYEFYQDGKPGLFGYQRLDRLIASNYSQQGRSTKLQEKSLKKLNKLYNSSAGIFLGSSVSDQQKFLSSNKLERQSVEVAVELWCNDYSFKFISEGTRRFPTEQLAMSPLLSSYNQIDKSIFKLPRTSDAVFPNRFQVKLPKWSLSDIDLKRWILGFGGNIRVVQPDSLANEIKLTGENILKAYE
ncbi:hypothetical protein DSM106972_047850 [Dulcicalothrix desertica PCC 7102]|uniref:Uncharacterized protein n=2 Tax=Dulcicalothrix desertica TaxID=32056 RepID=A0A433VCN3_9CYAN|nr:hypothetical protein DSM106972_047850 [Dulcicalothrix desertica PCC 7102]